MVYGVKKTINGLDGNGLLKTYTLSMEDKMAAGGFDGSAKKNPENNGILAGIPSPSHPQAPRLFARLKRNACHTGYTLEKEL